MENTKIDRFTNNIIFHEITSTVFIRILAMNELTPHTKTSRTKSSRKLEPHTNKNWIQTKVEFCLSMFNNSDKNANETWNLILILNTVHSRLNATSEQTTPRMMRKIAGKRLPHLDIHKICRPKTSEMNKC